MDKATHHEVGTLRVRNGDNQLFRVGEGSYDDQTVVQVFQNGKWVDYAREHRDVCERLTRPALTHDHRGLDYNAYASLIRRSTGVTLDPEPVALQRFNAMYPRPDWELLAHNDVTRTAGAKKGW